MRKLSILILLASIVLSAIVYKETTLKIVAGGGFNMLTFKERYFPTIGLEGN